MNITLPNEVVESIATQIATAIKPQVIQAVRTELLADRLLNKTDLSKELGISYNSMNEMTAIESFPRPIKGKYSRKAVDKWLEDVSKGAIYGG